MLLAHNHWLLEFGVGSALVGVPRRVNMKRNSHQSSRLTKWRRPRCDRPSIWGNPLPGCMCLIVIDTPSTEWHHEWELRKESDNTWQGTASVSFERTSLFLEVVYGLSRPVVITFVDSFPTPACLCLALQGRLCHALYLAAMSLARA